ncbi:MAG: HAD-IIB family hydrolase [Vibrio sp.]
MEYKTMERTTRTNNTNAQPVIFTDLDGTLIDHDTYCFADAQPALQQLKRLQIDVIPTTSKTFAELVELRQKLELDSPFIVENGAAIFVPKVAINSLPESIGTFQESFEKFQVNQPDLARKPLKAVGDFWCIELTEPRLNWVSCFDQAKQDFPHCFKLLSEMEVGEVAELTGLDLDSARLAIQRDYGEAVLWLGDKYQRAKFAQYLHNQQIELQQGGRFIHASSTKLGRAQKGHALHVLMALYQQQDPSRSFFSIALGDSENDISMLDQADIAVRIRSKYHDFPKLKMNEQKQGICDSQAYGPAGWAECVTQILSLSKE